MGSHMQEHRPNGFERKDMQLSPRFAQQNGLNLGFSNKAKESI
jgi:hypothetical protein